MTYYSDKILKIVKLCVLLLFLSLFGALLRLFLDVDIKLLSEVVITLKYIFITGIIALMSYLYGSYIESKKLITCTGCKVVNYVGNFIIYLILIAVLYMGNSFAWG